MTDNRAMELCRLAEQEGRPVDAYRYFLEASEDGIFYGYNIFPCTLFDEEEYPLYPDELCTLISGEDGLTLGFDPIRVMSSGWPNGVLKIDPIHIPQEQLKGEKVFLLLPIESSYYDEEILGRVDFRAEMGLLLEKTPEGWQIALLPEEDLHEN
ncbi:MAG: hypothetical protein IJD13_02835 [Oscillospiraceae bacterium]|nr:hypothetical protein [Oscillospiraceae bacterium]